MNAVERIEAAIQKLESLRLRGSDGPWKTDELSRGAGKVAISNDVGRFVAHYLEPFDAERIVTLHRTIDAQIAVLRYGLGIEIFIREDAVGWGQERMIRTNRNHQILALADAILGDAPAAEVTRLSGAWCLLLGYEILDPDGWDRTDFQRSWNEPITQAEFRRRARISTHRRVGDAS